MLRWSFDGLSFGLNERTSTANFCAIVLNKEPNKVLNLIVSHVRYRNLRVIVSSECKKCVSKNSTVLALSVLWTDWISSLEQGMASAFQNPAVLAALQVSVPPDPDSAHFFRDD